MSRFRIFQLNHLATCGLIAGLGLAFSITIQAATGQDAAKKVASSTSDAEDKPQGLDLSLGSQTGPIDPAAALQKMGYEDPVDKVMNTLADPPDAKKISKKSSLWVDTKNQRVYIDGYVSLRDAPLEMFACPAGTKEHESIIATLAKSSEVHAALLAIGATSGTTVKFEPKYVAATGQRIRVWVLYRDEQGKFKAIDARQWVRKGETKEQLEMDWVFAGSYTWTDPEDKVNYYQADGGDMICVSNFGTAMMDLPIESSQSNSSLSYMAFTDRIPARLTPVRLVLVPIAIPSGQADDAVKPPSPPDESLLPLKQPRPGIEKK